jgi:8-oxo-dGTP pyrophosphatase MutT (NUDIX family)
LPEGSPPLGRHSAAGLLACHTDAGGTVHVLLQQRSALSHHGNTWGVPGGARDSDETAQQAAMREAVEEAGLDPLSLRVFGNLDDPHGGWSYTTVLAAAPSLLPVTVTWESHQLRWVPADDVDGLPLHPGFADSWPTLRRHLRPLRLVVDAANVVGSRPDGWWRDRAGAAARLRDQLVRLAELGIPAGELPAPVAAEAGDPAAQTVIYPEIVMVVEGRARAVAGEPSGHPAVRVVAAPGEGDDEIVARAAEPGAAVIVVTADRALRGRAEEVGATAVGPGWLLRMAER